MKNYPDTRWLKNIRYVADGKVVTSAGITAAMPTAVALVEAIGGPQRAAAVAARLGLAYWGTRHDSDAFRLTAADYVVGIRNSYLSATETVGIPVAHGRKDSRTSGLPDFRTGVGFAHVFHW